MSSLLPPAIVPRLAPAVGLLLQAPPAGLQLRAFSQYRAVFLAVVVLGIVTELLQRALPNRSVSAADVLHDAAGAALGLALVWFVERRVARRRGVDAGDGRTAVAVAIALGAFMILAWQPLQAAPSCVSGPESPAPG